MRSIRLPAVLACCAVACVLLLAGYAGAGEPDADDPPGKPEPLPPEEPLAPPGPAGAAGANQSDTMTPGEQWRHLLAALDRDANRIHLGNVGGIGECVVGLPLTEASTMLDRPVQTARIARFMFTFKPWRPETMKATEISPEVLVAISTAYREKGNDKYARFVSEIARTLYRQADTVREMGGFVRHGGGWVTAELLNASETKPLEAFGEKLENAKKSIEAGDLDAAEKALFKITAVVNHPGAWVLIGDIQRARKKLPLAIGSYREALMYDAAWMEAYEKLGWALLDWSVENEADAEIETQLESSMENAMKYDPDGGKYLLPLAEYCFRLRKYVKANRLYRKACALDPSLALAWRRRVIIRENAGMVEDAFEVLLEGLAACPDDESLLFSRVRIIALNPGLEGSLEEACAEYMKAHPEGANAEKVNSFLDDFRKREKERKEKEGEEKGNEETEETEKAEKTGE